MAEADVPALHDRQLNILLLGKTGHGKSATGNSILMEEVFLSQPGGVSVTQECEVYGATVGGRHLNIVDTPGTMDTHNADAALKTLATAICRLDNHIDAVLIVLNYSTRMTDEEIFCFEKLKILFGDEVLDYILVIFTHADNYEKIKRRKKDPRTFTEYLKESSGAYLGDFLKECHDRYALIDNFAEEDKAKQQAINIIEMVESMVDNNKGRRYRNSFWHQLSTEEVSKDNDNIYMGELSPVAKSKIKELCPTAKETPEEVDDTTGNGSHAKKTTYSSFQAEYKQNDKPSSQKVDVSSLSKLEDGIHSTYDEMKNTGAECFPADATVLLAGGGYVKMKDLKVGDKVLSFSSALDGCHSEVYLFGHAQGGCKTTFVCLKTANHLLKVTGGHCVYSMKSGVSSVKAAKDISVGDVLLTLNEGRCVLEEVTDIGQTEATGLYAPFTLSGSIVVDGVLASCYVDVLPHLVAHNLLWPVRQLYRMCPSTLAMVSKTGDEGIPWWIRWCLDNILSA